MKKWFLALPLVLMAFAVTSCLNDNDDVPKKYYELMATVVSVGNNPSFLTDDGYTLNCTNAIGSDTAIHINDRFYLCFYFGDTTGHASMTYPVVISDHAEAKIGHYVSEDDSTAVSNDQQLYSAPVSWVSGNYINMIFATYVPLESLNTCQLVRLNDTIAKNDTLPTLNFELRHHTSFVSSYYRFNLFSFDLSPLVTEFPLAKKFNVNINWYDAVNGNDSETYSFNPHTTLNGTILKNKRALVNIPAFQSH